MPMKQADLRRANDLLAKVEEINKTFEMMRQQNVSWVFGIKPDVERNNSCMEPALIVVRGISVTAIHRFLREERAAFIEQLKTLGIETAGLDRPS